MFKIQEQCICKHPKRYCSLGPSLLLLRVNEQMVAASLAMPWMFLPLINIPAAVILQKCGALFCFLWQWCSI